MFKNLYKKYYKSSKKLTKEQVEELESKRSQLIQENESRLESIFKLKQLIIDDPDNKKIYSLHIRRNRDWINKVKKELEAIEIELLEK